MAFAVTPTSGAAPYLLTASFAEQHLINGMVYVLRVRSSTEVGVCPLVGFTLNPTFWATNLLENGSQSVLNNVPSGSCRTTTLQIVELSSNTIVSQMSVNVSNV